MTVTIYHNPSCSNSRRALEVIRETGIEPTIVEYLKAPLSAAQLRTLIARMNVPVKDVVRFKQAEAAQAGIDESSPDAALLAAMAQYPVLMNRPIVVTPKGARLCRPGDEVKDLL